MPGKEHTGESHTRAELIASLEQPRNCCYKRKEQRASERFGNLPEVTQLQSKESGIQAQVCVCQIVLMLRTMTATAVAVKVIMAAAIY